MVFSAKITFVRVNVWGPNVRACLLTIGRSFLGRSGRFLVLVRGPGNFLVHTNITFQRVALHFVALCCTTLHCLTCLHTHTWGFLHMWVTQNHGLQPKRLKWSNFRSCGGTPLRLGNFHTTIYLSIDLPTYLPIIYLPSYPSSCLSICLSICLSNYLSFDLSYVHFS